MKKEHVEEIMQKVKVVDELICNCCGGSFYPRYMGNECYENPLLHNFSTHFGYGSKYDGMYLDFDICDDCLLKFIKTFKIETVLTDIRP